MVKKIFKYNGILKQALANMALPEDFFSLNPHEPFNFLFALSKQITPESLQMLEMGAGASYSLPEILYYLFMEYRRYNPAYFPGHDLCLLAANILNNMSSSPSCVSLLDWELLPAAILLAGAGWKINFPDVDFEKYKNLVDFLEKNLPEIKYDFNGEKGKIKKFLLGKNMLAQQEVLDDLAHPDHTYAGALFLTAWDFLGVKLYNFTRQLWVMTGFLSAILQLPRLRRQQSMLYPAFVCLGNEKSTSMRFARVEKIDSGAGALNQNECLQLLFGKPIPERSIDLDINAIKKDGEFILTPAKWLNPETTLPKRNDPTLRTCAQILRCQIPRAKLPPDWVDAGEEKKYGWQTNGSFVAREVTLSNVNPVSGFLLPVGGGEVRLEGVALKNIGKYLIQKYDILFSFRGSEASLGKVGFVGEDPPVPTITAQAVCIIRCLPDIKPVWLYWYLQEASVKNTILRMASGASILNLNLDSLRSLTVKVPTDYEFESVMACHLNLEEDMTKISELYLHAEKVKKELARIVKALNKD